MQKIVITEEFTKYQLSDTRVEFSIEIEGTQMPITSDCVFSFPFLRDVERTYTVCEDGTLMVEIDNSIFESEEYKGITRNSIIYPDGLSINFEMEV